MVFWQLFLILKVFWSFRNFGSILAQKLNSSTCKTKIWFFHTPGTPEGTSIVEWMVYESIRPLCRGLHIIPTPPDFHTFLRSWWVNWIEWDWLDWVSRYLYASQSLDFSPPDFDISVAGLELCVARQHQMVHTMPNLNILSQNQLHRHKS